MTSQKRYRSVLSARDWEEAWAEVDEKRRRLAAERRACAKVPTEALERISVPKLLATCEKAADYLETVEQFGVRERELMEQLEAALAHAASGEEAGWTRNK